MKRWNKITFPPLTCRLNWSTWWSLESWIENVHVLNFSLTFAHRHCINWPVLAPGKYFHRDSYIKFFKMRTSQCKRLSVYIAFFFFVTLVSSVRNGSHMPSLTSPLMNAPKYILHSGKQGGLTWPSILSKNQVEKCLSQTSLAGVTPMKDDPSRRPHTSFQSIDCRSNETTLASVAQATCG